LLRLTTQQGEQAQGGAVARNWRAWRDCAGKAEPMKEWITEAIIPGALLVAATISVVYMLTN